MIQDVMVVAATLSACAAIGCPVCLILPANRFELRLTAAPPIGLGLFAVGGTLLYRWGIAPWISMLAMSAAGLVLSVSLSRPFWIAALSKRTAAFCAGVAAVAFICLLPAWTGGPQFSIFQGNFYDQMSFYLTGTVGFRSYDYVALLANSHSANPDPTLASALWVLNNRGAAAIVHAAVADLGGRNATLSGYAFPVALQVNMFFAASFVLVNVFAASARIAFLLAAALTVGFFEQYIVDINAWSQLAAQPLYLLLLATVAMAFDRDRFGGGAIAATTRIAVLFASLLAGVLYLYPEALTIYGFGATAILVMVLAERPNSGATSRGVTALGLGTCLALLLALLFRYGTIEYLYRQLSTQGLQHVDWWNYYQGYLLGRSEDYHAILLDPNWQQIARAGFSLPVESITAMLGLYFILPTASWPAVLAVLWKLGLYGFLAVLIVTASRATLRMLRSAPADSASRMVVGCAVGLLVPLAILCTGAYWSAGKGLAMVAPLLFLLVSSPLLVKIPVARIGWAASAALVTAHLALGALRPILVTPLAGSQLPGLPTVAAGVIGQKTGADWNQEHWLADLRKCNGVDLRVTQRFMNQVVKKILTDIHVPWADSTPNDGVAGFAGPYLPNGWESFECVALTDLPAAKAGRTLIWLGNDRSPFERFEAPAADLEVGTKSAAGVLTSGTYGIETTAGGPLQWTSQVALFKIPNNPAAPARRLRLKLWPMTLAADALRITVNGEAVYDGVIPSAEITLPLEKFSAQVRLAIQLQTNAVTHYPNDPRDLGVAIMELQLSK
jgi:hypothetical protein